MMKVVVMSLLFCIGVVLTADHYGPPQLIGINGKHFYMDHASPIDDSILYVSIHDHEYHDELGRRKVDTRPPSIFRKAEIHCAADCGYEVELFLTEYKSKFEDITFIRDGGEPRVYFFPAEVPDGDYRHIIPHELNGITVEGLFALLGTYGFFPSASR